MKQIQFKNLSFWLKLGIVAGIINGISMIVTVSLFVIATILSIIGY